MRHREWSNMELRKIAPTLTGDIINVSGWEDKDKEGGLYKENGFNVEYEEFSNNPDEVNYLFFVGSKKVKPHEELTRICSWVK